MTQHAPFFFFFVVLFFVSTAASFPFRSCQHLLFFPLLSIFRDCIFLAFHTGIDYHNSHFSRLCLVIYWVLSFFFHTTFWHLLYFSIICIVHHSYTKALVFSLLYYSQALCISHPLYLFYCSVVSLFRCGFLCHFFLPWKTAKLLAWTMWGLASPVW